MAEKRGAGADPSPAKKSAPAKGARGAGETKPQRSRSAARSSAPTAEGNATSKAATGRGASKAQGDGRAGRGSAATGTRSTTRSGGRRSGPDLRKDLRDFASARPDGWSHDDWLRFLDDLQARGHNINDRDQIGAMLERERLALTLERIPGVGPQRVKSIADRYGYVWRLRETDPDQLAREAHVPRSLAEKVVQAIRG